MTWMLICVGGTVVAAWLLSDGHDDLDYQGREIRASMRRREAADRAEMRRIRRARRHADLLAAVRWPWTARTPAWG
jgi:hypothetical protein